eukprot:GHVP01070693.1.p1 GENE.GHVP01070693.1~~GHVP01070693.1.p1  ORF type:complete len:107 (-),score=8.63 GHVP01070693.1:2035-2355(-)
MRTKILPGIQYIQKHCWVQFGTPNKEFQKPEALTRQASKNKNDQPDTPILSHLSFRDIERRKIRYQSRKRYTRIPMVPKRNYGSRPKNPKTSKNFGNRFAKLLPLG